MIFDLAKKLGQTEQTIKEQYTRAEIKERYAMELYTNYIDRETMKMK